MSNEVKSMNLNFYSKYDYLKSLQQVFGLNDEEANTFLWILEMWDKKQELPPPTEFKLCKMEEEKVKTPRDWIREIYAEPSNFKHIAENGTINGSLLIDIERVMNGYSEQLQSHIAKLEARNKDLEEALEYIKECSPSHGDYESFVDYLKFQAEQTLNKE